jgi:hypothetical protein
MQPVTVASQTTYLLFNLLWLQYLALVTGRLEGIVIRPYQLRHHSSVAMHVYLLDVTDACDYTDKQPTTEVYATSNSSQSHDQLALQLAVAAGIWRLSLGAWRAL